MLKYTLNLKLNFVWNLIHLERLCWYYWEGNSECWSVQRWKLELSECAVDIGNFSFAIETPFHLKFEIFSVELTKIHIKYRFSRWNCKKLNLNFRLWNWKKIILNCAKFRFELGLLQHFQLMCRRIRLKLWFSRWNWQDFVSN